jgi:alanine racemase
MNRLGISASKVNGQHGFSIENTATLDIKYIMSHLACADEKEHAKNSEQLIEFKSLAKKFTGIKLSIANSAGVFLGREYHLDMVRPGIALYGGNPTINSQNRMKNVIKLTSKILQIERVDSAGTVGYGATHKITRGTKIATIAVGYANGYLRSLSDRGICAVNGHIVPVIGRVSMDLVTIDVTKIPDEKLFDAEVELIGDYISVNEVAQKAGTISYEIITSLGGRYRIVYD